MVGVETTWRPDGVNDPPDRNLTTDGFSSTNKIL